ncbi:hypothetical protein BDL97_19G076000 [Sphagnum fallax]|nr:hypothetical protein BDL97_19G076000 [Sphagnum fallax]
MYRGRRFLSGFGKTDGRTGGRRAVARTDRTDWRKTDGREDARRTRGRVGRRPGDRPRKRASATERRERGREEKEEREREREKRCSAGDFLAHRSHFPPASSPSQERGKWPGERKERGRVRVRRFLRVTECCGSDGEERGAPAQILSKEGSVAS